MFLTALLIHVLFVRAVSVVLLPPPQDVHVDKWLVTWTRATEEDVSYTVQYRSFEDEEWMAVPGCIKITLSLCNGTLVQAEPNKPRCLMFRVQAERRGMNSMPVEACSNNGGDCSPEVNLTARPGILAVMLSRDHRLAKEYGDFAKHRVYYGKEGELLKDHEDDLASMSISGLEEGVRYCMTVEYMVFDKPAGPPRCIKCELIPQTKEEAGQTGIIVSVVAVVFLLALSLVVAYVLINHYEKIKELLRPPCEIPSHFHIDPIPQPYHPVSPIEERCDVISHITYKAAPGEIRPASPSISM